MIGVGHLTQEERDRQFVAFLEGDASDTKDIIARLSVVVSCGVALWFAIGQAVMLIWAFGYVTLNIIFISYLRRQKAPVRPSCLAIAIAGSIFIAAWYGAMVIYIATIGDGDFLVLACCGCIGLALHCISRNNQFNYSAYVDFWATIITAKAVVVVAFLDAPRISVGFVTVIGGCCVMGYFWFSFQQIITDRKNLSDKVRADVQDQKMRALGQLTSGVAHDFNNLLTVIIGNIELAQLDARSKDNPVYLSEAHNAAKRGAQLITQLLAYARQSQLFLSDVNLAELFDRLSSVLPRLLPAHITLEIGEVDDNSSLKGDAALLESALLNLVVNARDAIGKAPGKIHLSMRVNRATGHVDILVRDTGPGMDDDILARAAEPFFSTKPVGEGSGLGLSMVKGFAEQSGGNLFLENRSGGGLQACISLPLSADALPAKPPRMPARAQTRTSDTQSPAA